MAGAGDKTPIKDTNPLVAQYGGEPANWAKMRSKSYRGSDLVALETHWYEHVGLKGVKFEPKTKFEEH